MITINDNTWLQRQLPWSVCLLLHCRYSPGNQLIKFTFSAAFATERQQSSSDLKFKKKKWLLTCSSTLWWLFSCNNILSSAVKSINIKLSVSLNHCYLLNRSLCEGNYESKAYPRKNITYLLTINYILKSDQCKLSYSIKLYIVKQTVMKITKIITVWDHGIISCKRNVR